MITYRKKSQKQEKAVAKQFSARPVIASGSLWFADSDVRNDKFLIECKTTEKDYYSITSKVWEKIEEEALKDRMRTPLLIVDLRDTERYVVFNPNHFIKQLESVAPNVHGGCKSYRLKGYNKGDLPILFSVITLKNNKRNNTLVAMRVEEFIEYFKEEI